MKRLHLWLVAALGGTLMGFCLGCGDGGTYAPNPDAELENDPTMEEADPAMMEEEEFE